jgi:hypothetical protein
MSGVQPAMLRPEVASTTHPMNTRPKFYEAVLGHLKMLCILDSFGEDAATLTRLLANWMADTVTQVQEAFTWLSSSGSV